MVRNTHPSFTRVGKLEPHVREIVSDLNDDVSEVSGIPELDVEFNELRAVPPNKFDGYFRMVYLGSGIIGVNDDVLSSIVNEGPNGLKVSLSEGKQSTIRHEWAHAIDDDFNEEEYAELDPDNPWDILQAPKEAYATYEGSQIDSNFGGPHLENPWSIPGYWQNVASIDEEGLKIDGNPHKLGAYAAKKVDEAAKREKHGKFQGDFARRRLLASTSVEDLMEYTREAHEILEEPFYHDVLADEVEKVKDCEKRHVDDAIKSRAEEYSGNPEMDIEEFYENAALVESYKGIYGDHGEHLDRLEEAVKGVTGKNSDGIYNTI